MVKYYNYNITCVDITNIAVLKTIKSNVGLSISNYVI